MANLYSSARKDLNGGMVLVIALIFLFMLTLVSVSAMNTSLLETKMSSNYRDKLFSLQEAQIKLESDKLEILAIKNSKKLPANIKKIAVTLKGEIYYQVTVIGRYHQAKTMVQGTYLLSNNKLVRTSWQVF